jgi:RNA polymerase sigma factor (TIGR02999 family)
MGARRGSSQQEITDRLRDWSRGDPDALPALLPEVLPALRAMAAAYLDRERTGHTLEPTALVNELFVRLCSRRRLAWSNRAQFFGFAARTMRRILVDSARKHRSARRGGGAPALALAEDAVAVNPREVDLLGLDLALAELARLDPEQERLVELRYFAGLTVEEIAEMNGMSIATVHRRWASARAWLYRRLARK